MLMIKNGCWWIDAEPSCAGFRSWRQAHYSSNLAWPGSFSQITNTAISLLIPAGPSFSNPSDRHEAVKHWMTSRARTMMRNGTQVLLSPPNPFLHYAASVAPCSSLHYVSHSSIVENWWIGASHGKLFMQDYFICGEIFCLHEFVGIFLLSYVNLIWNFWACGYWAHASMTCSS